MEFKGTKGDWVKTTKYTSKNAYLVVQVEHGNGHKQDLFEYRISDDECTQTCCNIEQHANALLISKAPYLLETVDELLKELAFHGYTNSTAINYAKQLLREVTEI